MLDEPQNPIPEENLIPSSPKEPTLDIPVPPSTSEPIPVPSEAPETSREAEGAVPVNNDISQSTPVEPILDNGNKGINGESQTAQTPSIEPSNNPNITIEKTSDGVTITEVMPILQAQGEQPTAHSARNEPLVKSRISSAVGNTAKQEKVKKKLEKIVEFLNTKEKVTNNEVEKLLHVSDATATRYLSILEKEGKVKQVGRTGQSVSYSRI